MSKSGRQIYAFDNYRLDAGERQLLRDGEEVALPGKAFELLLVLVERRGRLVEKEELYERVWADQVVEESNLTVQMSALRKALGERKQNPRYIVTVAGHGYRFVGEQELLTKHYTENAEAYQLYLMGRYHLNRLTDAGFLKGLDYFQQAIEKDPSFALAHAGVADSYNALGGFNVRPPKEVYPKARAAAVAALNLDHQMAHAHTELAMINLTYDWDWSAAEREFKRAIELKPSDADAHFYYAYYLASMGQFNDAIAEIKKAEELDPVSLVKLTGLGQILIMARRYDEAIEECRKVLEMDPNLGFAHWLLGLAYTYKGSYEQAIVALQRSIPLSGDSPDEPASLAHAYALSGQRAEARKILNELKQSGRRRYISPTTIADLYSVLGEREQAFALLESAYDERDNMLVLLKVDPIFDPLRSDSRFTTLLRRVGFPQ